MNTRKWFSIAPSNKKIIFRLMLIFFVVMSVEIPCRLILRFYPFQHRSVNDFEGRFGKQEREPMPLFGYRYKRENGPWVNNFGFNDQHRFPYKKKPNDFVIGIFGGSVAEQLGTYLNALDYQRDLKQAFPHLKSKNIVILNFAMGGVRQPQQFVFLSYFIETIDMFIQVDGWNEHWVQISRNFPVNFPAFSDHLYSTDIFVRLKMTILEALNRFLKEMADGIYGDGHLSKVASIKLFHRLIDEISHRYLVAMSEDLAQKIYGDPLQENASPSEIQDQKANSWRKYVDLEATVARHKKIPHFFFVQPSQYVANAKIFTEKEKGSALNELFITGNDGFEKIRRVAKEMNNEGLPVFDLNGIFRNETRDIFVDDCCHLNKLGNEIMWEAILGHIKSARFL